MHLTTLWHTGCDKRCDWRSQTCTGACHVCQRASAQRCQDLTHLPADMLHVAAGASWPHWQQHAGVLQPPAPLGAQPSRGGGCTVAYCCSAQGCVAMILPEQLGPRDLLFSMLRLGLDACRLAHHSLACLTCI